ncbi:hypothetical protein ESOMN_v1c04720 [Williamsoniiplasma somnilux]|uniref:Uncharacterized protein n=1 Tax=Williamsoniiplasma somnilux TaxID=215578 RepID=A0A2K8NYN6_9MOLU|nr:hypothetical protein [Williamsoniiplasma somnilux]ATZ18854.1 hypothetical protein ESOMN_v1c04720 [Williamsoniiplasma somnilux]
MNAKELNLVNKKIIEIASYLKNNNLTPLENLKVKNLLTKIIDKFLINDLSIAKTLINNEFKSNGKEVDIHVESKTDISISEVHSFLYFLKTSLSFLLEKRPEFFNFYIYSEIKNILFFYIEETKRIALYDDYKIHFSQKQNGYHLQNSMYKYLYSIFDKLIYINVHLINKFDLRKIESLNYKFTQDFVQISNLLFKDKECERRTSLLLQNYQKSPIFHFVRKLRNSLEHSFNNPELKTSNSLSIETIFILIMRIILEIDLSFKRDHEIYNLLIKK